MKCHTVRETRKLVLEAGVGEMGKQEGIAMGKSTGKALGRNQKETHNSLRNSFKSHSNHKAQIYLKLGFTSLNTYLL